MAHPSYIATPFAQIFKEAKERLKMLLRDVILYADGLRPDEIGALIRQLDDIEWLFENDLEK